MDPEPFDGRELPDHRRDGTPWPQWARDSWEVWRRMPHAKLWHESDWVFAADTIELASRAFDEGAKIGLLTELRYREKAMGTTYAARMDLRIRYTQPSSSPPATVSVLDGFRQL